jgi:heat shock protein HtpX
MQRVTFYEEISKNKRNSIILAILVSIVLSLIAYLFLVFFGIFAFLIVLVIEIVYIYVTYTKGDQIVLKSVNAKPADDVKNRYLVDTVEGLAIAAGIPKPKIYIMESPEINAFATGKDPQHASICVTTGALENLKRDELEGVIGHEMSHIQNYDIRFATIVAVMVGLIAILSYMILRSFRYGNIKGERGKGGAVIIVLFVVALILAIFAPLVSRLVQAAVSRKRELLADSNGVKLTRYPDGLADALEKIQKMNNGKIDVSESMSHLFIADPRRSPLDNLFATHPPLQDRIKILRAMG